MPICITNQEIKNQNADKLLKYALIGFKSFLYHFYGVFISCLYIQQLFRIIMRIYMINEMNALKEITALSLLTIL